MTIDLADQATSPVPLQEGMQAEVAFSATHFTENGRVSLNPLLRVRYSAGRRLELGLDVQEGKYRDEYLEKTTQGLMPLALSAKVLTAGKTHSRNHLAMMCYIKLPFTSHTSAQAAHWSPAIMVLSDHVLSPKAELTLNAGMQQQPDNTDWTIPVSAGLILKPGGKTDLLLNYYAQLEMGGPPQHNLGGGIEFHVSPTLGYFLSAGSTVNPLDPNFFFAAGGALHLR